MDGNKQEAIQNFGDMVNATKELSKPWQEQSKRMTITLIITNLFWALIVALLVWFAYMSPVESEQVQDYENQIQNQSYSEGVTDGE